MSLSQPKSGIGLEKSPVVYFNLTMVKGVMYTGCKGLQPCKSLPHIIADIAEESGAASFMLGREASKVNVNRAWSSLVGPVVRGQGPVGLVVGFWGGAVGPFLWNFFAPGLCSRLLSGLVTLQESSVRSYLVGNAGSRPISEAKQPWACLVLRWGTTGEAHVLYSPKSTFSIENVEAGWQ